MPKTPSRTKFSLYWPAIVAFFLASGVLAVLDKFATLSLAIPWALVSLLAFGTTLSVGRMKNSMESLQVAITESTTLKKQLAEPMTAAGQPPAIENY